MRVASRLVLAIALVAVACATFAAPASSAVPSWTVVPSASPPGATSGSLSGVACASPTACFAVGSYSSGRSGDALLEHFDGTGWSLESLPTPDTTTGTYGGISLSDVACPGPTTCFAVGSSSVETKSEALIERWDGTAWSIVPFTDAAEVRQLVSVSCSSVTRCFAASGVNTQLEQWNGLTWSLAQTPSTPEGSGLYAVTCASTTCAAVGTAYVNFQSALLIEQWNGTAWSVATSPAPAGGSFLMFNSVSCATDTSCLAVGSYEIGRQTKVLVEQWNGTSWSIVPGPTFAKGSVSGLADVSCTSATDCFAAGDASQGRNPNGSIKAYLSLVERWNGVSWSIVPTPNADPKSDFLQSLACSSSTSCLAVGFAGGGLSAKATIESWNGTSWSVVTTPQPTPSNSTLSAVSCPSATTCFGVGSFTSASGATVTLIERENAAGWTVVPSPNPAGSRENALSGVSCPSVTDCFAVGTAEGKNHFETTLTERWNGKVWSIVPSPDVPDTVVSLTSVSCTSANFCFAVGQRQEAVIETFVERWNGAKWSIVPSPSRTPSPIFETAGVNDLESVSCASATSCMAVGGDTGYLDKFNETLALRWNGSKWSIVKSANGAMYSTLSSVSCPTPTSCYAVGNSVAKPGPAVPMQSLIEHWNGTTWTRVPNADSASATRSALSGISCPNSTQCFAVGDDSGSAGRNTTLVKTLTGGNWSIASSPNPAGAVDAALNGVSCPSAITCSAVGSFDQFSAPLTLVESFS